MAKIGAIIYDISQCLGLDYAFGYRSHGLIGKGEMIVSCWSFD